MQFRMVSAKVLGCLPVPCLSENQRLKATVCRAAELRHRARQFCNHRCNKTCARSETTPSGAKAGACFLFSSCVLVEFGKASVTCAGARARTAVTCLLNLISPQSCSCLFIFVCSSLCLSSASCLCRFLPGRASSCSFATLLLLQPARPHAGVECELRL